MGAVWSFYVYVSCKDNATCEGKLEFFDTTFESKINKLDEIVAVNTAYSSKIFRAKIYLTH